MLYCRVSLDVPVQLVIKVSALLRKHREELGSSSARVSCVPDGYDSQVWEEVPACLTRVTGVPLSPR